MQKMGASVNISNLVKRYGSSVTAVDNANVNVTAGEFLSILGPSGSGKTSLLMCLAGFEIPTSGTISIGDRNVTTLPPNRREIGIIFQKYALFPHMSVRENVRFPLRMRGMSKAQSEPIVNEALSTVRLSTFGDRLPAQLSGGQQQRVAIARAISFRPPLLLMDEPLSALDKKLREEMQIEIKELQRKLGLTIIFVTHDQEEALTMSDRIAVMSQGKIEQIASPDTLYHAPQTQFVAGFVGESSQLQGTVSSVAGETVFINLKDGGHVEALTPFGTHLAPQSIVDVYVRPEHIRTLKVGSEPEAAQATVISRSFTGATTVVTAETKSGTRITARLSLDAARELGIGAPILFAIEPRKAVCFSSAGTRP
ncbi:ABC transporter ATP-binding protein [Paenochrobactrum sp. BZR 588]|uniref:ABC transporter ATP-binding protein n=1 Tax=Paenochrobactrum TaxID=999488 RepID=UPI0035BBC910